MGNLLKSIMLIKEEESDRAVFAKPQHEGGINTVYDPQSDKEIYQVFVQSTFPCREVFSKEFQEYAEARNFAASYFKEGWELLSWNKVLNRPCAKGDACGGGNCSTNKEGGEGGGCGTGGCSSCGSTKEFDELMTEDPVS